MTYYPPSADLTRLVGARVLGLSLGDEERYLRFETDRGELIYAVEGECCSLSWIADIVGVSRLLGEVITAAEEVDMPDPTDERSRSQEDVQYGVKLTTAAGYVDIVHRNASNGYYGGALVGPLEAPKFDVPQNVDWRPITEDWSG